MEPRLAKLAYLTIPERGTFVLNVHFGGKKFLRARITRSQLAGIIRDGIEPALSCEMNASFCGDQ